MCNLFRTCCSSYHTIPSPSAGPSRDTLSSIPRAKAAQQACLQILTYKPFIACYCLFTACMIGSCAYLSWAIVSIDNDDSSSSDNDSSHSDNDPSHFTRLFLETALFSLFGTCCLFSFYCSGLIHQEYKLILEQGDQYIPIARRASLERPNEGSGFE